MFYIYSIQINKFEVCPNVCTELAPKLLNRFWWNFHESYRLLRICFLFHFDIGFVCQWDRVSSHIKILGAKPVRVASLTNKHTNSHFTSLTQNTARIIVMCPNNTRLYAFVILLATINEFWDNLFLSKDRIIKIITPILIHFTYIVCQEIQQPATLF